MSASKWRQIQSTYLVVQEDDIERRRIATCSARQDLVESNLSILSRADFTAKLREQTRHEFTSKQVVIDDQNIERYAGTFRSLIRRRCTLRRSTACCARQRARRRQLRILSVILWALTRAISRR